jgi:hypothetical protein
MSMKHREEFAAGDGAQGRQSVGRTRTFVTVVAVGILTAWAGILGAQQKAGATSDPRILAYDKGPAKINVSKYPAEVKAAYKVFEQRCSACHSLARAVNCEFALDDEWQHYIRQMMDRGGSLISADEAKAIFSFVTYDSKTRKKDLYDKKLASASTK